MILQVGILNPAIARPATTVAALVSRPKLWGPAEHFGIFVSEFWLLLPEQVIDLTADQGYRRLSTEQFAAERKVTVHEIKVGQEADEVIARLKRILEAPRPWSLLGFNCEDMARAAFSGRQRSLQIEGVLLIGLGLIAAAALSR